MYDLFKYDLNMKIAIYRKKSATCASIKLTKVVKIGQSVAMFCRKH
ncbi:hypothetical protein BN439_1293 [Erwinia amylovora Ea644]|nr:hypothetical protein BN439_1293 [Erwinia amylovora Ea644]